MRTVFLSAVALLLIMLKASQATPASAQPGFSPARGNYRAADEERAKAASRYSAQPAPMQAPSGTLPTRSSTNSTRLNKVKKAKRCCCCCCPCCCGCGCCGCGCGCCGCGCGCCGCGCGCGCCRRRRNVGEKKGAVNKTMRPDYSTIRRGKRSIPEQKPEEECDCEKEEQNEKCDEKPANDEACDCEGAKEEKCADDKEEMKDEKEEKCEEEKEQTEKKGEKEEESCGCDKTDDEETTEAPSTTAAPIDESKILFRFRKVAPSPAAYKVTTPSSEDDDEDEDEEAEGEVKDDAEADGDNDDDVSTTAPAESTITPSEEEAAIKNRKTE